MGHKCNHHFNHPYTWEHDNGYGRQKKFEGRRCSTCQAVDFWNDGDWVKPENIYHGDY